MNGKAIVPARLLTWLDVERLLKHRTMLWTMLPKAVLRVDCFASAMEIQHAGDAGLVESWLAEVFGPAFRRDSRSIQLRIGDTPYPVELMSDSDIAVQPAGKSYPLWSEVTYLPVEPAEEPAGATVAISDLRHLSAPQPFDGGPELVSFHSFKGGVGRTTTLMTYVASCLKDSSAGQKRILVIDADLEAPGVSFWLDEANRPTVSFVQLLEALHYPPAGLDATLEFFANELRKTSISVGGLQRELFVLPAALDLAALQDMPVTPEHLARNPENPWHLCDHLHELGRRLGADAVFIDLRAGLSELASPILFDPRVDHFFVSTVAPQSVLGMAEVLRRLYARNRLSRGNWREEARPTVVLSLLTKELRDSGHYETALKTLDAAYPAEDPLTPGLQWLEAEFLSTLMSIGSIREALDSLPQASRLFASAVEWSESLYTQRSMPALPVGGNVDGGSAPSKQALAKKLRDVCAGAEFAEGGQESPILAIEPLLNLGKHFSRELPSALMIGAKGSGKTFTFRQVVRSTSWKKFLIKLGFQPDDVSDAAIFPVLWSDNISDKPDGEIKNAQNSAVEKFGGTKGSLLAGSELKRRIETALKAPPAHWEDFWDGLIAAQFGVDGGGLTEVNELLTQRSCRMILIFDGIEDAFKDAGESPATEAIQALLRLTNRINELANRHLGVLVFVRADYVQAVIRQNLGQWLQRFLPFRLQWDAESFLRLACMLSRQAQVLEFSVPAESLRMDELKSALERLWGKKLGSEKSKEAHSARWVYAALCDLKGNVQARDLVRFLKFAADEESVRTGQAWPDRLLAPESMRKAIPRCSEEKVTESKAEIASLRRWSEQMSEKQIRNLRVPFSAAGAGLDAGLLGALKEIGVIYEDLDGDLGEERLFLPEIYRTGLGFETSAAGRPRMQALLKKNIGVIPL